MPVVLQARIDDSQLQPNVLPNRFTFPRAKARTQVSGQAGWIPLARLSEKAAGVGFVDFSTTVVPLLETYQSQTVKSLIVCCIELTTGKQAVIEPSQRLRFGMHELPVDAHNCVSVKLPAKDDLEYIPFHRLAAGEMPVSQIKGKIVILGYDGPQIHSIPTSIGPIRAHRFFVHPLKSVYERLGSRLLQ